MGRVSVWIATQRRQRWPGRSRRRSGRPRERSDPGTIGTAPRRTPAAGRTSSRGRRATASRARGRGSRPWLEDDQEGIHKRGMLRRRVRGRWSDGGNAEFFVFVEVRRKCEWKRVLVAVERDDAGAWDFRVQAIVRRRAGVLGGKHLGRGRRACRRYGDRVVGFCVGNDEHDRYGTGCNR